MAPGQSLVRHDNPVLVSRSDAVTGKAEKKALSGSEKGKAGIKKLPPVDDKSAKSPTQTEDILNSILPPRYI